MTQRKILEMALHAVSEPTHHLLTQCDQVLKDEEQADLHRMVGRALDRWNISKEELEVRTRLIDSPDCAV